MTDHFDVIIVGLGPVGAAGAILFASNGLSVAVIEKTPEIYALPRAVGMDGEVVRAFQQIGLGEALDAKLQPMRADGAAGFANSQREWLFGQESVAFGSNGWQPVAMFDQPEMEGFLRDLLGNFDNIEVHLSKAMTGFTQHEDHVAVAVTDVDSGTAQELKASYLVACDGAASPTRKALGIGWHDLGYDHDWLVIDVTVNDRHTLENKTLQVCDPARITTYVCTKDPYRRWEFKLNPGETWDEMLDDEKIFSLLDAWTPRDSYTLRRKAMYQFHAATADTWREGRVFIAGDAAHQTPPFLGQGMNAGIRDVINLAWKLPMVLDGSASPALLDSYEAERKPHAEDLVEWAVAIGRLMDHLAAVEAAQQRGEPAPDTAAKSRSAGYGQGREAPPLRDGVVIIDQVSDTGSTGYLFRQPIVSDGNGVQRRLDDCYGAGFVLVTKSDDVALGEASRKIAAAINMRVFSLAGLKAERGRFDPLFEQADAVIVRPDRYVFGHTSETVDVDGLVAMLGEKLLLTHQ